MKTLLKILVLAAAFGLSPGAVVAQTNPAVTPELTQEQKAALPAQPEDVSSPGMASDANPPAAEVATKAIAPANVTKPEAGVGMPQSGYWQGFQEQYTPIGEEAAWFHNIILMPLITIISLFVLALMLYVIVRYRRSANPTPSRTTHNTFIEVVWTLLPVLILVAIAVPSIRLLAHQYSPPEADITVKAIGNQWYWTYQYPDHGDFEIISNMLSDKDAQARSEPRLLGVDERMVVPAGATVKVIVTSNDVIHSWGVPSFWTKIDAVPGRLNETWFKVDRPGVYYGQCFELCGARHGYMPIAVEVMEPARFAAWVGSKGGTMPGAEAAAAPAAGDLVTTAGSSATETTPPVPAVVDATAQPPVSTQGATNSKRGDSQ
jgi:cytochrome c oxidase subunit 2